MANLILSPSMSAKLKTRETARKLKEGSPKLQEVLRQRCRERMRQKRGQLFGKARAGLEEEEHVQEVLTEIVRQEFSGLATSEWSKPGFLHEILDPDEALDTEKEILAEQEIWIVEEYERLMRNEDEMLALLAEESLKEGVICPICQKELLSEFQDSIVCNLCGLSLPSVVSITDLGRIINENVSSHSEMCTEVPGFTITLENNNNCLYFICHKCNMFSVLI